MFIKSCRRNKNGKPYAYWQLVESYRTLDVILPLKSKIERHLKQRIGELFAPDFDVLLYDVTSTYGFGKLTT